MARPTMAGKARDASILIRVLPTERQRWKAAAAADGVSLSQWIRTMANAEAARLGYPDPREDR